MTKSAENWMRQEQEMCDMRVRLHHGTQHRYESGNPMTEEQAAEHMKGVREYIDKHPELYP